MESQQRQFSLRSDVNHDDDDGDVHNDDNDNVNGDNDNKDVLGHGY